VLLGAQRWPLGEQFADLKVGAKFTLGWMQMQARAVFL